MWVITLIQEQRGKQGVSVGDLQTSEAVHDRGVIIDADRILGR